MKILNSFVDVNKRISRSEWFLRILIIAITCTAFGNLAENFIEGIGAALFAGIFLLLAISLSIQRLHDISTSGWKLLLVLVPVLGPLWVLILLLKRGVDGANRYGDDPLTRKDYLRVNINR